MRICFVSPASNYHTLKWVDWFSNQGHEVHVISFAYADIPNATVHALHSKVAINASDVRKIGYLTHGKQLRRIIKNINPDIINVHYASSYGALAAVSGIKGYVLSIWGSDVYEFPEKSLLHRALLKYSLSKADVLLSTSAAMAKHASKYTNKQFEVTPFGVNMELFNPAKRTRSKTESDEFIVGTVKALRPKYGIEYLIKSVAIVRNDYPEIPIRLRIAGKGDYEEAYKILAKKFNVDDITTWLGFIPQETAAQEWANMDVAVVPSVSESESFGVSAVEAEACGTPVIISDIPGLMEATDPGNSSVIVPRKDEDALAKQIVELFYHPEKRLSLGKCGRTYVEDRFDIDHCFMNIERKFREIIAMRE